MTGPADPPTTEDVAVQRLTALRLQLLTTAAAAVAAADAVDQLIVEREDQLAQQEADRG